jgi:hypothetical protein
VGQAKLPFVGMPGLRRVTVGDPDLGLGLAEEIIEHCGGAAVGDQMVESECGAVALGQACVFPPLSFGGALVARP